MSTPTEPQRFDALIHAPIRLRICASLAPVQWAEFAQLRDLLGITDSVLSKHLRQLDAAGYLRAERFSRAGRSHTRLSLSAAGRAAYVGHLAALREITGTTR